MLELKEKVALIAKALKLKKAMDICALQVEKLTTLTEVFVIASAASASQLRAMADEVDETLGKAGDPPRALEGTAAGGWILIDCGSVIVQLFHKDKRNYYQIERLWADGTPLDLKDGEEQKAD